MKKVRNFFKNIIFTILVLRLCKRYLVPDTSHGRKLRVGEKISQNGGWYRWLARAWYEKYQI